MANTRTIVTREIGGNDLLSVQTALSKMIEATRMASMEMFDGASTIHVENCDGWAPHSVQLVEETLTDGSKVYNVRLLFVGDV